MARTGERSATKPRAPGVTIRPQAAAPAGPGLPAAPERLFDIDVAMERLREAVRPLPKAAMFQLADEGFGSLFEQLVACIISIRTLEEITLPTARRLFAVARTPAEMARLDPA